MSYNNTDNEKNINDVKLSLIKRIIRSGLINDNLDIHYYEFDKIYIDLDSVLSLIIKEDLPEDEYYKKDICSYILDTFREFFEMYDSVAQIYILYNLSSDTSLNKIYNKWCEKRYKRYNNKNIMDFIFNNLLKRLKNYCKVVKNVQIIKCDDAVVLHVLKLLNTNNNNTKSSVVLSRDTHHVCLLAYHDVNIYTGKFILNRNNYHTDNEIPKIHYSLLPNYYLISGMSRNEYKGVNKFGQKKTELWINKNKSSIIDMSDTIYESVIDYKDLFFINNLV